MFADHKLQFTYVPSAGDGFTVAAPNMMDLTGLSGVNACVGQSIDLFNAGAHDIGSIIRCHLQVAGEFQSAGSPTLDIRLQASATNAWGGEEVDLVATDAIATATLVAGYNLIPGYSFLAADALRYLRFEVDINTTTYSAGAGKNLLWGGVIIDPQAGHGAT